MKIFRVITDSFSGYEAQVKYSLFPFVWFQMNAFKGVNTWNTCQQAIDFIQQKTEGTFISPKNSQKGLVPMDVEVKHMLFTGHLSHYNEVVWTNALPELQGSFRLAY